MRPEQRIRRSQLEARLGRPDPKAVEKSMRDLVELVAPPQSRIRVHSDEHAAYPRAFRKASGREVVHTTTSSKKARTSGNPLFPVNRMDLLLRHCGAHHKRETIAYSKRRQRMVERLAMFAVWVNYMKSFSEKKRDATPAQRLGIWRGKLTVEQLLRRRLFESRVKLPDRWGAYYRGRLVTKGVPNGVEHALQYAF
jgi:hypothetical protein